MSATSTTNSPEVERQPSVSSEAVLSQPKRDEVPAELRRALLEQQQNLTARLATADGTAYTTSYLPGHEEQNDRSARQIRRLLKETESVAGRIDDGNYGSCHGCAEPISFVRLEIQPHTRYCLTCQQGQDAQRR